ncbi:lysophospholipid acyltransferase family protein [Caldichromatium japonicum]|nr:lysophospholipid acyltransferase family protein [Caldichromatium japonicum]
MMVARILWRTARLSEHLITGSVIAWSATLLNRQRAAWLPQAVRWWHARLLRALGVQVWVSGQLEPNCLLVANHISWLDIPVLGAQAEIYFLSKSEVRRWPLIGWFAELAGTRFIERGAYQAEAVIRQLGSDLEQGRTTMIFPEGTTTDGQKVRPFHPRLFTIAQTSARHIQPVAIRYRRLDDPAPDLTVPYIGDDSLLANLWRVICHPGLIAQVVFLDPIQPHAGETRRALAQRARASILAALSALDHPADGGTTMPADVGPLSFPSETQAA